MREPKRVLDHLLRFFFFGLDTPLQPSPLEVCRLGRGRHAFIMATQAMGEAEFPWPPVWTSLLCMYARYHPPLGDKAFITGMGWDGGWIGSFWGDGVATAFAHIESLPAARSDSARSD